jgi:cell division protein FtsZ
MNNSTTIKAIGIGSTSCTIVNHLYKQEIKGVGFMVCDTDVQGMANSLVPNKVLLDKSSCEDIEQQFEITTSTVFNKKENGTTKIVLIIVELGNTTLTDFTLVLAQQVKKREIITIGIVSIPLLIKEKLGYEETLLEIKKLRKQFDSLVVVDYNKSIPLSKNLDSKILFSEFTEVYTSIVKGIATMVLHLTKKKSSLRFIKTVFGNSGSAFIGTSVGLGVNRAKNAIESALFSPLLKDTKITNAKNVLVLITSFAVEIKMDEIAEISDSIQSEAGFNANVIIGVGEDDTLGEALGIILIATGFDIAEN